MNSLVTKQQRAFVESDMDPETLEALRGSIEKWRGIVAGKIKNEGALNCPLCLKFLMDAAYPRRCDGCPVKKHTGHRGCAGTPYDEYEQAEASADSAAMIAAARAELAFLESLLPENNR